MNVAFAARGRTNVYTAVKADAYMHGPSQAPCTQTEDEWPVAIFEFEFIAQMAMHRLEVGLSRDIGRRGLVEA